MLSKPYDLIIYDNPVQKEEHTSLPLLTLGLYLIISSVLSSCQNFCVGTYLCFSKGHPGLIKANNNHEIFIVCVLKDFRDYPVTMILFFSTASNNFE